MPTHIHIAADHAGFDLKSFLIEHLKAKGLEVTDHGTDSSESTDYPDYIHPMATAVQDASDPAKTLGIAICGSANGVCMTANKHADIRAAIAWQPELAELARQHNNANVLCLPSRFISEKTAKAIVDSYLAAEFEGGRHQRRVSKIAVAK